MEPKKEYSKVALVTCGSYEPQEVESALSRALALLGGFEAIFADRLVDRETKLILKPNLLAKSPPERACTTHPAVFQAAGRLLQKAGYKNLSYGDSPGNPLIKVEKVAEECGIRQAAKRLDIPSGSFESGRTVDFPEGEVCSQFVLCDEITDDAVVINLCKMKTHQLERITGAVKNALGCVYGANKGAFHARFTTAESFADMMADLNALVSPALHIMDGIVAMEGNGPQSGTPKAMNVILVSTDPVAMDTVFCQLVDLAPQLVPTNVSGMRRGIGTCDAEAIRVITEEGTMTPGEAADRYGDKTFDVQRGADYRGTLKTIGILAPFLDKKPFIRKNRCVGCGICVRSCPLPEKALRFAGREGAGRRSARIPGYDYDKCIKCWCCQEMCPEEAIGVKKPALLRLAQLLGKV